MTVGEAVARSGLVRLDAQVLLAHALGVDRAWLVAHASERCPAKRCAAFAELAARRRAGEPVAYLTGVREFWGLPLAVDARVLIPRPETETLVEQALAVLPADREALVLDLGTGSGAIALAIAHARPRAVVVASDNSGDALACACGNAERLKLANVRLLQSDWYDALPSQRTGFDLIASNPPYVAVGDPHLGEGDVRFEPMAALRAGADGLDALRIVVRGAPSRLVPGGTLVVEHGFDQAAAVRALMVEVGFADVGTARDLAGRERVTRGRTRSHP
jgi:release factor glutamine methyltransferase